MTSLLKMSTISKRTKVVCTIGPASCNVETLKEMIRNGMNVARFNMSHGNHDFHRNQLKNVRQAISETGANVACLLDTKGPEVRLGFFKNGFTVVKEGQRYIFTSDSVEGDENKCTCNYERIYQDLKKGNIIFVNDGLLQFKVVEIQGHDVVTEVIRGGKMSNQKAMNFPGVLLSLPYMSENDKNDLIFGCKEGFDFVAASFVSTVENAREVRKVLNENGGEKIQIIAKIENQAGVDNVESILEVAHGIMVARGDMGVEVLLERLPSIQKQLINITRKIGKIVIVATEMLESMCENPRPTRAEVNDVANAVFDGADAVMLSGETAAGKHPALCVLTMSKICAEAESNVNYHDWLVNSEYRFNKKPADAISHATVQASYDLKAKLIITFTQSGFTPRMVSRYRPATQVVACTDIQKTHAQMALVWGVKSHLIKSGETIDEMFETAHEVAVNFGCKSGDIVAITMGTAMTMKLYVLP